jgi:hypothetical protein
MGLLAQLRENAKNVDPRRMITEDKAVASENFRRQLIEQGERLYDETYSRYTGLGKLLESEDPREKFKAAMTLNMLARVENLVVSVCTMRRTTVDLGTGNGVTTTFAGTLGTQPIRKKQCQDRYRYWW